MSWSDTFNPHLRPWTKNKYIPKQLQCFGYSLKERAVFLFLFFFFFFCVCFDLILPLMFTALSQVDSPRSYYRRCVVCRIKTNKQQTCRNGCRGSRSLAIGCLEARVGWRDGGSARVSCSFLLQCLGCRVLTLHCGRRARGDHPAAGLPVQTVVGPIN